MAVLFLTVFPARAWLAQRRDRQRLADEVHTLVARNQALEERVRRLGTDAEIERLARQQYQLVRPGEEVYFLPPAEAPPPPASTRPGPEPPSRGSWWGRVWDRLGSILQR